MKNCFPNNSSLFSGLRKNLFIIFYILYTLVMIGVSVHFDKKNQFYLTSFLGIAISAVYVGAIIFRNRHDLTSLGICTKGLKITIVLFVLIVGISFFMNYPQFSSSEVSICDYIFNMIIYFCMFFFVEEFIYRAYLGPKLMRLYNKHLGAVISGVLWGSMHILLNIGRPDMQVNSLLIFNSITSGIAGQYIFMFFYKKVGNIFFPVFLHMAPHILTTEITYKISVFTR